MVDVPEQLKVLLFHMGLSKQEFSNIALVNLKITKMNTFEELGYIVPGRSRFELRAAMKRGYVTIPVSYGQAKNEVYDCNSNFVCELIEK